MEVSLERDREAFLPAVLFVGRGLRRDLLMQGWSLPAPLYEALPMELLASSRGLASSSRSVEFLLALSQNAEAACVGPCIYKKEV